MAQIRNVTGGSNSKYHLAQIQVDIHNTTRAKNNILDRNPETTLPMEDEERRYKYGQFGYGKYIYPKEAFETIKAFFEEKLTHYMPNSEIKYLV